MEQDRPTHEEVANTPIRELRVYKGSREQVELGVTRDLFVTVPRGQYEKLSPVMEVQARIEGGSIPSPALHESGLVLTHDLEPQRCIDEQQ